jgi:hypothetical protein
MTEKTKSQMNLIPVAVLVVLIIGAGYFLLKGEIKFPNFGDDTPEVRRLNGFPTVVYTDKEVDKQRVVITSEEQLNQFLNSVDPTGILQLQEKINFDKEILIGASTKTNPTTGTDLKIKKIYQDKEAKKLQVNLRQSEDADTCEIEQDKNIAVDLVAINKTDWQIDFDVYKEVKQCDSGSTDSSSNSSQ